MPWVVLRDAYFEDVERLNASAMRFIERHDLWEELEFIDADLNVWLRLDRALDTWREYDPSDPTIKRLYPLWRGCKRRALRDSLATGIAWGSVGYPQP